MASFEDRESKLLSSDDDDEQQQQSTHRTFLAKDDNAYYMRLGLSKDATQQDIRRAFLKLSQAYHTDKYMTEPETVQAAMNVRFQELQEAYSVLSDIKKRAAYDAAGVKGIGRLALVPEGWTSADDIIRYVRTLEREQELLNTAKTLSATSDTKITFSVAHLFPYIKSILSNHPSASSSFISPLSFPSAALPTPNIEEESSLGTPQKVPTPPISTPTSANNWEIGSASTPSSSPLDSDKGDSGAEAKEDPDTEVRFKGGVTAAEIMLNGKQQIVLIPPNEMQDGIRKAIQAKLGQAGMCKSGSCGVGQSITPPKPSAAAVFLLTVLPRSIHFQNSFEHRVSPRLNFVFRTTALAEGKVRKFIMGTTAEYKKNLLTTYGATVQARCNGLKISLLHRRILDPLWVLRSKLTLLDGVELLQKFQLTLSRKLSSMTELDNTIAWSLSENGFFQTSLTRVLESESQYLAVHIGRQMLALNALVISEVTFGASGPDARDSSPRGSARYRVTSSPLSGTTQVGFELWYYHRKLKHYGLSFKTEIPYAPSIPRLSPLFTANPHHIMSNQISLLYERGKHSISIPIFVIFSPTISHSLMWVSVPLFLYRVGKLLYLPYANVRAAERAAELRMKHIADIDIAREKAIMEQKTLEWRTLQSCAEESSCDGLIIINAQYGVLNPNQGASAFEACLKAARTSNHFSVLATLSESIRSCSIRGILSYLSFSQSSPLGSPTGSSVNGKPIGNKIDADDLNHGELDGVIDVPLTLDVTIALQSFVRDSKLLLPAGPKSQLVGFCDPDPYALVQRQLKITYWFRKKRHHVVLNDDDPVELPQREHLVSQKTRSQRGR